MLWNPRVVSVLDDLETEADVYDRLAGTDDVLQLVHDGGAGTVWIWVEGGGRSNGLIVGGTLEVRGDLIGQRGIVTDIEIDDPTAWRDPNIDVSIIPFDALPDHVVDA